MALKWVKPVYPLVIILLLAAPFASSVAQIVSPKKLGGYKNANYREIFEYVEKNRVNGGGSLYLLEPTFPQMR